MAKVGVGYSFVPTASDPDSDPVSFSVENKPDWATFDAANGDLSGIPLPGAEGTYSGIVISVSDGLSSTSMAPFPITVEPATAANMPPEISGEPATKVSVGAVYFFTPSASDPDGDPLIFGAHHLPVWATFDSGTGQISGTPQPGEEGTYAGISITVSDGTSSASLPAFSITVNQVQLGSVTLNWTPPTLNTDGSTLADLSGFVIYYGIAPGDYTTSIALDNPGLSSYFVDNLVPDTYHFVITAKNSLGAESSYSNVASKTVD